MSTHDNHCRRPKCQCQHDHCFRGWIDNDRTTTPCDTCRPDTWRRWMDRETARAKDYPHESLNRIMQGTT